MLSGTPGARVHWLDWELRTISRSTLSTWEDKDHSLYNQIPHFFPLKTLTKLLGLLLHCSEMSLEDDAPIRLSLMGPLTLYLCNLAPIVFILLQTGFHQKPGRFLMMCIQKTEIQVPCRKKKKRSFCTLCYYCTFCTVYTKLDFKKDIGLFFSLSYMVENQGNFTFIRFTWE